jgi:hypothetical protein
MEEKTSKFKHQTSKVKEKIRILKLQGLFEAKLRGFRFKLAGEQHSDKGTRLRFLTTAGKAGEERHNFHGLSYNFHRISPIIL